MKDSNWPAGGIKQKTSYWSARTTGAFLVAQAERVGVDGDPRWLDRLRLRMRVINRPDETGVWECSGEHSASDRKTIEFFQQKQTGSNLKACTIESLTGIRSTFECPAVIFIVRGTGSVMSGSVYKGLPLWNFVQKWNPLQKLLPKRNNSNKTKLMKINCEVWTSVKEMRGSSVWDLRGRCVQQANNISYCSRAAMMDTIWFLLIRAIGACRFFFKKKSPIRLWVEISLNWNKWSLQMTHYRPGVLNLIWLTIPAQIWIKIIKINNLQISLEAVHQINAMLTETCTRRASWAMRSGGTNNDNL